MVLNQEILKIECIRMPWHVVIRTDLDAKRGKEITFKVHCKTLRNQERKFELAEIQKHSGNHC